MSTYFSSSPMIAKRIPTVLPDMTLEEALETTKIHSILGLLGTDVPLIAIYPYRSLHHTISDAGLTGGGKFPRPGSVLEFRQKFLELMVGEEVNLLKCCLK